MTRIEEIKQRMDRPMDRVQAFADIAFLIGEFEEAVKVVRGLVDGVEQWIGPLEPIESATVFLNRFPEGK